MTEKNYVVNSKTAKGTIVTVRADTASELDANIDAFIDAGIAYKISIFESEVANGGGGNAPSFDPIAVVTESLGATVISETPIVQQQPQSFAPVPPPVPTATPAVGSRTCTHGPMTGRKGTSAKGEWKAFFCPGPKGAQCDPVWLNRKDSDWNTI